MERQYPAGQRGMQPESGSPIAVTDLTDQPEHPSRSAKYGQPEPGDGAWRGRTCMGEVDEKHRLAEQDETESNRR